MPYYNPLFADRFNWALEFRIRCGSVSYVVKDIDGMADALSLIHIFPPGAVFICLQSAGALGSGCFVPKDGTAVAMCPLGRVGWMH